MFYTLTHVTSCEFLMGGWYNVWPVQILTHHSFHSIQSRMNDICGVPFHYVSFKFLWNEYFLLIRYKFYSISASAKRNILILRIIIFSVSKGSYCWYQSKIFNDKVNVPSCSSSMLYSYDIFSIVYSDSYIVFWFPLLGNCDSVSATIYFSPGVYSISGMYSSSMSLQCNTRLVLKFFHGRFLWSVNIFNCWPDKIVQNFFMVLTILIHSFPITVYRVFVLVRLWM